MGSVNSVDNINLSRKHYKTEADKFAENYQEFSNGLMRKFKELGRFIFDPPLAINLAISLFQRVVN